MLNFEQLKTRHRSCRDTDAYSSHLNVRIHRSLSWLQRAEMAKDDNDSCFIFLWIGFNAAYANEIPRDIYSSTNHTSTQLEFRQFLEKLCQLDHEKRINQLVWNKYSGPIRILLENRFALQAFWNFHSGLISETEWKQQLHHGLKSANSAIAQGDTPKLLSIIFNRLYTMRNQLMHGGSTWNSSYNRHQLQDSTHFLGKLLPLVIDIMLDHPETDWGKIFYPPLSNDIS